MAWSDLNYHPFYYTLQISNKGLSTHIYIKNIYSHKCNGIYMHMGDYNN